jgi:hypothetical protein
LAAGADDHDHADAVLPSVSPRLRTGARPRPTRTLGAVRDTV